MNTTPRPAGPPKGPPRGTSPLRTAMDALNRVPPSVLNRAVSPAQSQSRAAPTTPSTAAPRTAFNPPPPPSFPQRASSPTSPGRRGVPLESDDQAMFDSAARRVSDEGCTRYDRRGLVMVPDRRNFVMSLPDGHERLIKNAVSADVTKRFAYTFDRSYIQNMSNPVPNAGRHLQSGSVFEKMRDDPLYGWDERRDREDRHPDDARSSARRGASSTRAGTPTTGRSPGYNDRGRDRDRDDAVSYNRTSDSRRYDSRERRGDSPRRRADSPRRGRADERDEELFPRAHSRRHRDDQFDLSYGPTPRRHAAERVPESLRHTPMQWDDPSYTSHRSRRSGDGDVPSSRQRSPGASSRAQASSLRSHERRTRPHDNDFRDYEGW